MGSKIKKDLPKIGTKKFRMRQQGLKEWKLKENLKKKQWGQLHQLNLQRQREWQKRQKGHQKLQRHSKLQKKWLRKKERKLKEGQLKRLKRPGGQLKLQKK